MTQAGMILGTAAYLSPEQAKGRPVDRRADIWAFGAVLFEMLTGTRAFPGEDITDTIVSVISKEPDFAALPAPVPARVTQALRVCLRKDAKQRAHDMADGRLALEGAFETTAPLSTQTPIGSSRGRWLWMAACAVASLVAVALAVPAVRHLRETPAEAHAITTTLLPPDGAEFDFNSSRALPAMSPDGTRIVFGARTKATASMLYVRRLDSLDARPLPGTEGADFPFWSPDGRSVGFGQGTTLKKVDVDGGPAVTLVNDIVAPMPGGSWSRAGVIIYGTNQSSALMQVSSAGGAPATVLELPPNGQVAVQPTYPWFLPDGRHFIYTARQVGDIPVRVGSLDEPGNPGKVVAHAHSNAM